MARENVIHFELNTIDKITSVLYQYILEGHSILAFYGEIGAGKTTVIKHICSTYLNVIEATSSPSFSIINEYTATNGLVNKSVNRPVFHFDFYRLKEVKEVFDIGAIDYFYSGDICLIEWPEIIEKELPDSTVSIFLERIDEKKRVAKLQLSR